MAQNILVSTMQERARVMCGLPAFSTDTTVTTANILDFAKSACAMLGGIVKEYGGEWHTATSSALTTVAGIEVISVPSQLSELLSLKWQKSDSEEIDLSYAALDEMRAHPSAWNDGYPIRYRLVGQTITFFPTPDDEYTLNAFYTTGLYPTAASDSISCRDGWDQWIALQMAIMCRGVQQKACPEFEMQLEKVESSIRRQLKRDRNGIRQARDVRGGEWREMARARRVY